MRLWFLLTREIRPPLPFGWPLIVFAAPALAGLFFCIDTMFEGFDPGETNWRLHPFCLFLSRPSVVLLLAGVWVAVDLMLLVWVNRAQRWGTEPAYPVRLLFIWQGVIFSLFVLYFAVLFAYRPFEPYFDLHPCHIE